MYQVVKSWRYMPDGVTPCRRAVLVVSDGLTIDEAREKCEAFNQSRTPKEEVRGIMYELRRKY